MTDWRDIATAPRDGTHILVRYYHGVTTAAAWRLPQLGEPHNQSHYEPEWRTHSGHWGTATHWQPLPSPPEE